MLALSGAETEMEEKEMNCLRIAIWICSCLAFTCPVLAVSVTLAWDPVSDPRVTAYRLYVGIQSLKAGNPPITFYRTTDTQYRVDGLDVGTEYFFCASSVIESEFSNEVTYTPPLPTPTPIPVFVTNPNFDDDQFNTQFPKGWKEWETVTGASYTETFGGSHSGARHLTHYSPNAYRVYTWQVITSLPPGNYRVEVWAMTTGGQNATGIAIKENGIQKVWLNFPVGQAYSKLSATVNVLNSLEIGFWTDSPGGKWSYIDDVSVVVVP
jgi:hypothetical protein